MKKEYTFKTQAERDAYMAGQEWGMKKAKKEVQEKIVDECSHVASFGKWETYGDPPVLQARKCTYCGYKEFETIGPKMKKRNN